MSIFGKKQGPPPPSFDRPRPRVEPPRASQPPASSVRPVDPGRSYLGPGCSFEGDLHSPGSFECRGNVSGSVDVEGEIVIGKGGKVNATLKGRRIVINGHLEGDALGGEKVEVGASGHVAGDVRAPAVQFAEGAFFEGNVEMRSARPRSEPDAEAAPEQQSGGSGSKEPA